MDVFSFDRPLRLGVCSPDNARSHYRHIHETVAMAIEWLGGVFSWSI